MGLLLSTGCSLPELVDPAPAENQPGDAEGDESRPEDHDHDGATPDGPPVAFDFDCIELDRIQPPLIIPPAGVRVGFRVLDCDGNPIGDIDPADIAVINDARQEEFGSGYEGGSVSGLGLPTDYGVHTVLALDMSDSIHNAGRLDSMIDGALDFIAHIRSYADESVNHELALTIFGRPNAFELVADFTTDYDQIVAELEELRIEPSRGSTDLYGAFQEAVSLVQTRGTRAELVERFVVILTDGTHEAGDEVTLREEALATKEAHPDLNIYSIGIEGAYDPERLEELASTGENFVPVAAAEELGRAFHEVAFRLDAAARANYVVSVCTPISLGDDASLTIRLKARASDGAPVEAEATVVYPLENLTGDLPGCDADANQQIDPPGACEGVLSFDDPRFEDAISRVIEVETGEIRAADVADLTSLTTPHSHGITDLGGIECLAALESLYVPWNELNDLSGLAHHPALRSLSLSGNNVRDLTALTDLPDLEHLDLNSNYISDIAPLAHLADLNHLDLGGNHVSELAPLADLTELRRLELDYSSVTDLAQLADLTALEWLDVAYNRIDDLTPLANLTAMQQLSLRDCQVSDLTPLLGLTALQSLDVSNHSRRGNPRNDVRDLTPLAHHTHLRSLIARSNNISDLTPLTNLTALQNLRLEDNDITDLAPLAGLTAMQDLSLDDNDVSDLTPLAGLTALRSLSLATTAVSATSHPWSGSPNCTICGCLAPPSIAMTSVRIWTRSTRSSRAMAAGSSCVLRTLSAQAVPRRIGVRTIAPRGT